jgi:hypothetical protein
VPTIFDPLLVTSLACTVIWYLVVKIEEKSVLQTVMQLTANKPLNGGLLNDSMQAEKKKTSPDSTNISATNFVSAFKKKIVKNTSS